METLKRLHFCAALAKNRVRRHIPWPLHNQLQRPTCVIENS